MCDKPQIGDECWFYDDGVYEKFKGTLVATTSDGRFVDKDDTVWKYCEKIKKKVTIVKKASEIIKWCEDHDYIWHRNGLTPPNFMKLPDLFWIKLKYCGVKLNDVPLTYKYHEDWLEEKEV